MRNPATELRRTLLLRLSEKSRRGANLCPARRRKRLRGASSGRFTPPETLSRRLYYDFSDSFSRETVCNSGKASLWTPKRGQKGPQAPFRRHWCHRKRALKGAPTIYQAVSLETVWKIGKAAVRRPPSGERGWRSPISPSRAAELTRSRSASAIFQTVSLRGWVNKG